MRTGLRPFAILLILILSGIAGAVSSGAVPKPLQYRMTIHMDKGNIVIQLFPGAAPHTVARVVELIRGKFYNGLTFHRVEPDFVVQGGDPKGNGTGGSGVKLKAEFNSKRHVTGTVSMARGKDPDSADSQFFICLSPHSALDGKYTVIGQVISGMDVVRKITKGDVMRQVTVQ
ncbi:MAG: peptidylprolyl isomerase [Acidobacteriia bacterium]|nr:peptidylprolyl isomerase [Terriglobia bacterium]